MLKPDSEQANFSSHSQALLELLLFVDDRPSSQEHVQQLSSYLQSLKEQYCFALQVIELKEQPHLVEHLKLIATPALVKMSPLPRQTLAGTDLIAQLKKWWPRWQLSIEQEQNSTQPDESNSEKKSASVVDSVGYSTEVMRLKDEIFRLKKEKEELLEQVQFKDQILAMLAHDLRSPLTAASIAVETLELAENHRATKQIPGLKEQLYRQAKRQFQIMNRMIADLLQASKSLSAKLEVKPIAFHLQSLCQEIATQFKEQLQNKSQTLELDLPQDIPFVYADEELIRQVIVNLLDNAIKYTPEGGTIKISILHRTTQKVQVSISDNGPGIPEEKQERIFEGHFRLKRDEEKEGYGLGLSLCRKIVRAHYGQIWVDSVPDEGSAFRFTLPVYL